MDQRLEILANKAKCLPKSPGVYLMKDDKDRVIYVGKALSLRDRVSSYFLPSTRLEAKKAGLLLEVVDFDTIQTDTEVEALLTENRLIKDIQPKFNARQLDDKTFPYLLITTADDYPGVYITRQPPTDHAKLYGPFTSPHQLKQALHILQKAFKFRTCHLQIRQDDPKKRFFRPCLLYAIHQCTGPCADKISPDAYLQDIRRLIRFLDGDRHAVLLELQNDMTAASNNLQFEHAARLRDRLRALQALSHRATTGTEQFWQPEAFVSNPHQSLVKLQQVLALPETPRILEGIDIAHLQGNEMVGSKVCFIDGLPFKNAYRRYKIRHNLGNNDYLSIQEVVSRRYRDAGDSNELFPDLILIDGGLGQLHAAMDVFSSMNIKPPMVISLAKKEELLYTHTRSTPIRLPKNHPALKLLQYVRDEAHRFAQHYHHILRRKSQLEQQAAQGRRPHLRNKTKPQP